MDNPETATKFTLEIETTNDAFAEDPSAEVAAILRDLADDIEGSALDGFRRSIRDSNGNRVGTASTT